jgi:hypothetical protein
VGTFNYFFALALKAEPALTRQLSEDIASVYDFKDDGISELEVEVKDARWMEGLATTPVASQSLKLKVIGGKVSRYLSLYESHPSYH